MRVRNTKHTRQMLRIEHPDTGRGVYSYTWVGGAQRSSHPAKWCPAPCEDWKLMDQVVGFLHPKVKSVERMSCTDAWGEFAVNTRWRKAGAWLWCPVTNEYRETCPWIFGVPNMRTLKAWFSPDSRRRAQRRGLVVSIYEAHASAVMVGETQAIMYGPAARRIAMYPVPI